MCNQLKPLTAYHKNKNSKNGIHARCKVYRRKVENERAKKIKKSQNNTLSRKKTMLKEINEQKKDFIKHLIWQLNSERLTPYPVECLRDLIGNQFHIDVGLLDLMDTLDEMVII